jgi:cold shock CspA family protein
MTITPRPANAPAHFKNDAGGPDMYLHASALKEANIDPDALKIGDPLTYDVSRTDDGKTKASNVQRA